MLWVFEERFTPLRLFIVGLSGVGYLVLAPDGEVLTPLDLGLALFTIGFGFVGIWSPLIVVCGLSIAMAVANFFGAGNDSVPTVGLAWAMFELGARREGRQIWIGLAFGVAGTLINDYGELVEVALTVLYAAAAAVATPLLVGTYMRTLRELGRQASERSAQEIQRVRADERASIARELHDLVAHHVASIVLRVAVARNVLPLDDPRVRQVLDDVHATGSGALADLRRLVTVLRDPGAAQHVSFVDPEGLPVALRSAVDSSERIGLSVTADIDPAVAGLDARTALAVLRLTQEGLANVAKHAGTAARARLSVALEGGRVRFELEDSGGPGAGGGGNGAGNGGGHGLVGLRERVEVLGGELHAGPARSGYLLQARIPAQTGAVTA